MPAPPALLDRLRRLVPETGAGRRVRLGLPAIDAALSGGLKQSALHEIYSAGGHDGAAASGFALALALRVAAGRPVVWVRQDMLDVETGQLHAPGLAGLGLSPGRVVVVRGRDGDDVLRAGEEAVRCGGVGAVILAPWRAPAGSALTVSRRLGLAAAASGVTALMLRIAADPAPSAAETRWRVAAAPSRRLGAEAPGLPVFDVTLLRQRGGMAGQSWLVEWNRDRERFVSPLSRPVVPVPADGTADASLRRTG